MAARGYPSLQNAYLVKAVKVAEREAVLSANTKAKRNRLKALANAGYIRKKTEGKPTVDVLLGKAKAKDLESSPKTGRERILTRKRNEKYRAKKRAQTQWKGGNEVELLKQKRRLSRWSFC